MPKEYEDPETLAKLRKPWSDNEGMSYEEIANELGVSTGTISIRFNEEYYPSLNEKINSYGPDDFQFDTPTDELDELDPEEVVAVVVEEASEYGEPVLGGTTVEVGEIYLFVSAVSDGVSEAMSEAYESRMANAFVAVSEHKMSQTLRDKFDDEAIGLLAVNEDGFEVVEECRITIGSGIRPLFDGRDHHYTSYQSKAWIKHQIENDATVQELCDKCSVLPRTLDNILDRYGLDPNW